MKRQKISKSHPALLTPHLQLQTSQDFVSTRSKCQNFVLASIQGFLLLRTEGQQGCWSSHALLFALPVLHSLLLMATVPVHRAALPLKSFWFLSLRALHLSLLFSKGFILLHREQVPRSWSTKHPCWHPFQGVRQSPAWLPWMLPLGKVKTPQQVISSRVCHLRTILLPLCRMTDSRDKMVLLLLCCIVEMLKGVEREGKGSWRSGVPYGNRLVLVIKETLWPCQSQLLPKYTTERGKRNNHKKKLNSNPFHFSVFHFHVQYIAEDQSHFI